jgi:hypothetical protein
MFYGRIRSEEKIVNPYKYMHRTHKDGWETVF